MSDATFNATKAAFGERGVIDLIGVMGWYTMVSMVLTSTSVRCPTVSSRSCDNPSRLASRSTRSQTNYLIRLCQFVSTRIVCPAA
jgi:hypothetical protein